MLNEIEIVACGDYGFDDIGLVAVVFHDKRAVAISGCDDGLVKTCKVKAVLRNSRRVLASGQIPDCAGVDVDDLISHAELARSHRKGKKK